MVGKLLWLVLWRSEKARDEGERMLASVLNVSSVLAPMLAEPLGTEKWPEAAIFWRPSAQPRPTLAQSTLTQSQTHPPAEADS